MFKPMIRMAAASIGEERIMKPFKFAPFLAMLCTFAFSGRGVLADTVLAIDLNQFQVTVTVGAARTLTLVDDANTQINSIAINNVVQTLSSTGPGNLGGWTGVLTADGDGNSGTITGSFTLTDNDGDTYSISSMSGTYFNLGSPNGILVSAITNGGEFGGVGDGLFQGVNVSAFAPPPLSGSFLQFFLDPTTFSSGGVDANVDADITVVVPLPGAPWMGMALIGGIGIIGYLRRLGRRDD